MGTLTLPKELFRNCQGFSIHYGCSKFTIVYKEKDIRKTSCEHKEEGEHENVKLTSFEKDDVEKVVDFLQENCHVTHSDNVLPLLFATGDDIYGTSDRLSQALNVRFENVPEMGSIVSAFNCLARYLPTGQMTYSFSEEDYKYLEMVKQIIIYRTKFVEKASATGHSQGIVPHLEPQAWDQVIKRMEPETSEIPLRLILEDLYPCLLVVMESDFIFLEVRGDGSYKLRNYFKSAGSAFHTCGSVLAQKKMSFTELMDFAELGDHSNVDATAGDAPKMSSSKNVNAAEDPSSGFMEHPMAKKFAYFPFAKMHLRGCYEGLKCEDKVNALLHTTLMCTADNIFDTVLLTNTNHVFVAGSLVDREMVRNMLVDNFTRRKTHTGFFNYGKGLNAQMHFLKVGAHLGALGALITNTTERPASATQRSSADD